MTSMINGESPDHSAAGTSTLDAGQVAAALKGELLSILRSHTPCHAKKRAAGDVNAEIYSTPPKQRPGRRGSGQNATTDHQGTPRHPKGVGGKRGEREPHSRVL